MDSLLAKVNPYLEMSLLGNPVVAYLEALGIFLAIIGLMWAFKKYGLRKLKKWSENTETNLDDYIVEFIADIRYPFYMATAAWLSSLILTMHDMLDNFLFTVFMAAVAWYGLKICMHLINWARDWLINKEFENGGPSDAAILLIAKVAKIVLWCFALLFLISNLGVDVFTFVAGLSILGVAVGFASKTSVENFMTGLLMLTIDRFCDTGDFLSIEGVGSGSLIEIGILNTRLRVPQGEELIVPNHKFGSAVVRNFKKLKKRRVVNNGLVISRYNTAEQKWQAKEIIKNVFAETDNADLDRVHILPPTMTGHEIEIVYYTTDVYSEHMNAQETWGIEITDALLKADIKLGRERRVIENAQ